MTFFTIFFGCLLTVLSAAILSYISIATMVGPWIAPTLVLMIGIILKLRKGSSKPSLVQQTILIQAIAAGGGAIATGIGFALPALYFLDPATFTRWVNDHSHFYTIISLMCLSAGCFGILFGRLFSKKITENKSLPFPVSQFTYQAATSQTDIKREHLFLSGTISAIGISFLRDGLLRFQGIIPKEIHFFQQILGKELSFSIWPTLWAIGYTTGISVTLPLLVGVASKYLILDPLNYHSTYLSFSIFQPFSHITFATAFCAGLVLAEVSLGIISQIKKIKPFIHNYLVNLSSLVATIKKVFKPAPRDTSAPSHWKHLSLAIATIEPLIALISFFFLFSYFEFSLIEQASFLAFAGIATYEICHIGCEIGLVQYGRFSVFVMIPMILLFRINFIQITAVCVFFNICAATASDFLFDSKTGSYCNMDKSKLHLAQWLGLLATSLTIGLILHLLFTQLELGSAQFFAHRGRSKALLITSLNFNYYVVGIGLVYGLVLKRFKISPTMTLGGIIMPNNITIGLVIGGVISYVTRKMQIDLLPFFSGIFASETLWIIMTLLLKMMF